LWVKNLTSPSPNHATPVAGDRFPNQHVELCPVEDKDKAVAAVEDPAPFVELHGKKRRRETEKDHGEYIVVLGM
jgi:hypothetical protein